MPYVDGLNFSKVEVGSGQMNLVQLQDLFFFSASDLMTALTS